MADILNTTDGTPRVRAGGLETTAMRYHELCIQRWLNSLFFVREGYPVPVVITSPMDAFSHFKELWASANNPFAYLYTLKDSKGAPLYEPHPANVRYPIISCHRKGWKYRQYQNFSIHRWRHLNWPTISNTGTNIPGVDAQSVGLVKCDLGNVTTSRMPMAWDFKFQIDFFCNRPDTQAFFVEQLMQDMWRTGGATPQTWLSITYPGWGKQNIRLYIDGDIENLTPEEPETDKNVEFRTSFTVVLEGFDLDVRYEVFPAFWTLVFRNSAGSSVPPWLLDAAYNLIDVVDVRAEGEENPTMDVRTNIPSSGTCVTELRNIPEDIIITLNGLRSGNTFGQFTVISS